MPVNPFFSKSVNSLKMNAKNADPADEIICYCSGTTRGDIQRYFAQGLDIEAISQWTGAISGCGGCEWEISVFLHELAEQQK